VLHLMAARSHKNFGVMSEAKVASFLV